MHTLHGATHLCGAHIVQVIETAHNVGLNTTATIMFGHVDGPRNWARHLIAIRDLQQRTGGITEFVPLPFVHMEAPIYLKGGALLRLPRRWQSPCLEHLALFNRSAAVSKALATIFTITGSCGEVCLSCWLSTCRQNEEGMLGLFRMCSRMCTGMRMLYTGQLC